MLASRDRQGPGGFSTRKGFTTREQVDGLSLEDIDRLFTDGRKSVVDEFVPVDIERVVAARLGRNKPPLKVLWARYLETDAPAGARFYGYERFCQIVAEHVRVNDLTLPIAHVPAHTMQVDWAGTQMQLTDPITRETTRVSVFVASLPFSGMVFAYGCLDEKQPAWLDAHRRAFEHFGGVTQVVIPDNASTASNQISRTEKAREGMLSMRSSWSTTPPPRSRPALSSLATRGMSRRG